MHLLYQNYSLADSYTCIIVTRDQTIQGANYTSQNFASANYSETEQRSAISFRTFPWETAPLAASMYETKITGAFKTHRQHCKLIQQPRIILFEKQTNKTPQNNSILASTSNTA